MKSERFLAGLCFLFAAFLSSCRAGPTTGPRSRIRFAASESAVNLFAKAPPFAGGWSLSPLRPESREAELDVLLFSSNSPAFAGMILRAPRVSLVAPWSREVPFPPSGGVPLRKEVAQSLAGSSGLKAVPLTVDVPLLVYRKDLWALHKLEDPTTLTALKQALWTLRSWDPPTGGRIVTDFPGEHLFWSLAWSFEGEFSTNLYRKGKVQALQLMLEMVGAGRHAEIRAPELFISGQASAILTDPSGARRIRASLESAGQRDRFGAACLPGDAGARAQNSGWCLAVLPSFSGDASTWDEFASESFLQWVRGQGMEPASAIPSAPTDPIAELVTATQLSPDLVPTEILVVAQEALADVVSGAAEPEEALRRARARSLE